MSQIEVELTRDAASDEAARARKAEAGRRSGFGALRHQTDVPDELSGHWAQCCGLIEIDAEHRQPRQSPVCLDDVQALGYRVAEQRRHREIGFERRAHRLHIADLADGLPISPRLLQGSDGHRPEHARIGAESWLLKAAKDCPKTTVRMAFVRIFTT
jgi:hypothetical protein